MQADRRDTAPGFVRPVTWTYNSTSCCSIYCNSSYQCLCKKMWLLIHERTRLMAAHCSNFLLFFSRSAKLHMFIRSLFEHNPASQKSCPTRACTISALVCWRVCRLVISLGKLGLLHLGQGRHLLFVPGTKYVPLEMPGSSMNTTSTYRHLMGSDAVRVEHSQL